MRSRLLYFSIDGAITSPTLTVSQYKANQGEEVDFLTCQQKYSIADIKEMIEVLSTFEFQHVVHNVSRLYVPIWIYTNS